MKTNNEVKIYRKSRRNLKSYPEGLMIICTSKPAKKVTKGNYGENFLYKFGAWGFVNLSRDPKYFSLYVSTPVSAIKYFGVVENILDPREEGHPVDNFRNYKSYNPGDKLIMLKRDKIIELEDLIPNEETRIQKFRYTTLNKFIEAETTKDL